MMIKYRLCSLSAVLSSLLLLSACGAEPAPETDKTAAPISSAAVQTEAPFLETPETPESLEPASPKASGVPEADAAPVILPEELPHSDELPAPEPAAEAFSFADLDGLEFFCSSGVGAWSDTLAINADGSFSGQFHDMDMGDSGDGYPNGTAYLSNYAGEFSSPEQVSAHEYRFTLKKLTENTAEHTEIKDGVLYHYVPNELPEGSEFTIYLPDTPMDQAPEYALIWLDENQDTISRYIISNDPQGMPYVSTVHDPAAEAQTLLSGAEAEEDWLLEQVNSGELVSQAELNQNAQDRYECWDNLLNDLWAMLKEELPPEEMEQLLTEQRAWLREKEQAVKDSGKEVEGGSLYPLVTADTAADLTRDRCYVLAERLP